MHKVYNSGKYYLSRLHTIERNLMFDLYFVYLWYIWMIYEIELFKL